MSIRKKIVWLPYDLDTAIGINNEGELVFDYRLEDIDQTAGGADVFNGQQSVIWKNIRACFFDELKSMYQSLRSSGALSYAKVEQMFEEHQNKWPENIFNEDAWFKYIEPFVKDNDDYLGMLQGSKAEQRKWWLYNRFRYIDSKYNAGDALTDTILIRPYGVANISIRPYADIYATVKWDDNITQERASRGSVVTLLCPYESMNDNVVTIYSASQLASIGDISGLKAGVVNISNATRLQELKVGDEASSYSNANLRSLTLGNNVLLKKLDVRNCVGLGDTTLEGHNQQTVDISGCTNIEEVYFDNTNVTSVTLPNGGVLKKLHLPATVTNLTILNQKSITEFIIPSYANISTLRLENVPTIDSKAILNAIPTNSRVRLIGFYWTATNAAEITALFNRLDSMRGLDETGGNVETAQVSGEIHTGSLTGAEIAEFNARYPYVRVTADHTSSILRYYNGTTLLTTETVLDGGDGSYSGTTPTKAQDARYTYTFSGWSKGSDDGTVDADALTNVVADRDVYACFTETLRTYTVTWVNNGTTIETDNNVPYGTIPHYDGATPTKDGQTSTGWSPDPTLPITGDTTFTAQYLPVYTITFKNDTGTTTLDTQNVVQGGTATYGGTTPTSSEDASLTWLGWATSANSHTANAVLTNIQASATVYAAFESSVEVAEITDSWDTIIANIANGVDAYNVGNYKPLDLGTEGIVNMQIVGKNTSPLASGSGYAMYDWLSKELLLTTSHRMNPDIQYGTKSVASWTASNNIWTSQNRYAVSTAKATWTVTAAEAGTFTIAYKTSNADTSKNKITKLTVNGTDVITNYANTTDSSYNVEVAANDTVTVYCEYDLLTASYNYYATITFSGTGAFSVNAEVQNANTRDSSVGISGTGTIGGWENCEMRTYLKNTIKPLIPEVVRNAIKSVTKYTKIYDTSVQTVNNVASTEDVWLPSMREMNFSAYETEGPQYKAAFPNSASRVKMKTGTSKALAWWCRSANSGSSFYGVNNRGNANNYGASNSYPLPLGFST